MASIIDRFDGENEFLSNFFPSPIPFTLLNGEIVTAPTVEHAYQAYKAGTVSAQNAILNAETPGRAKRMGRTVEMGWSQDLWDRTRVSVMFWFLSEKFALHEELRQKLVATGDAKLIEGNNWGDEFWGCVREKGAWSGRNKLGELLMHIRSKFQ
jgi:ribA/ribD-fused uncharacterized protein